ncbi:MAG: hypothetical protein WAP55_02810 [Minisyncoccia bacterium]
MRKIFGILPGVYLAAIVILSVVNLWLDWQYMMDLTGNYYPPKMATTVVAVVLLFLLILFFKVYDLCTWAALSAEERRIAKNLEPYLKKILHL